MGWIILVYALATYAIFIIAVYDDDDDDDV